MTKIRSRKKNELNVTKSVKAIKIPIWQLNDSFGIFRSGEKKRWKKHRRKLMKSESESEVVMKYVRMQKSHYRKYFLIKQFRGRSYCLRSKAGSPPREFDELAHRRDGSRAE